VGSALSRVVSRFSRVEILPLHPAQRGAEAHALPAAGYDSRAIWRSL
jgi:hypothetical protein